MFILQWKKEQNDVAMIFLLCIRYYEGFFKLTIEITLMLILWAYLFPLEAQLFLLFCLCLYLTLKLPSYRQ